MNKLRAAITGVAAYAPDDILTNADLEKMVDTSDDWIMSRTGIKTRHILKGEGLGSAHLGTQAVKRLLQKTNTDPKEVDLVICATATPDMLFPANANLIQEGCGMINAFGYDIMAACSGFVYTLATASQFIETGKFKKVIVVGADKMSSIVDYTDRSTCVIFGDGAGAVLLEPTTEDLGIIDICLKTDGSGWKHLHQKAGGSRLPASEETVKAGQHFIYQEGPIVFKKAVKSMAEVTAEIMQRNDLKVEDIAWLSPHQANKRIIDATAEHMGLSSDKVMITIEKYGNTTNGTIPISLNDYESQLKKGDNIILAAFGGGFTWGSIYLKWAYNPQ